jgi:hypothetical protein
MPQLIHHDILALEALANGACAPLWCGRWQEALTWRGDLDHPLRSLGKWASQVVLFGGDSLDRWFQMVTRDTHQGKFWWIELARKRVNTPSGRCECSDLSLNSSTCDHAGIHTKHGCHGSRNWKIGRYENVVLRNIDQTSRWPWKLSMLNIPLIYPKVILPHWLTPSE